MALERGPLPLPTLSLSLAGAQKTPEEVPVQPGFVAREITTQPSPGTRTWMQVSRGGGTRGRRAGVARDRKGGAGEVHPFPQAGAGSPHSCAARESCSSALRPALRHWGEGPQGPARALAVSLLGQRGWGAGPGGEEGLRVTPALSDPACTSPIAVLRQGQFQDVPHPPRTQSTRVGPTMDSAWTGYRGAEGSPGESEMVVGKWTTSPDRKSVV